MANLEYSTDALNAKSAFYRVKAMVYVEGEEDILFWHEIFSRIPGFTFQTESVGGSTELDKKIAEIEGGHLHAVAARDADFLRFMGSTSTSPRVVYTKGYAIENTLFLGHAIQVITKTWCKHPEMTLSECETWLADIATMFRPLVQLDIANALSGAGVEVLGDNCTRFMGGKRSSVPCKAKISNHVAIVSGKVHQKSGNNATNVLGTDTESVLAAIRGHFLASAVAKFIVSRAHALGKRVSISSDALYASAISCFASTFSKTHPHFAHYFPDARSAAATF